MKVRLMHRDRDFRLPLVDRGPSRTSGPAALGWMKARHLETLSQDLGLDILTRTMGGGDEFLATVAEQALSQGIGSGPNIVRYRQDVIRDCLRNPGAVGGLYRVAVEALAWRRGQWLGIFSRTPSGILFEAVRTLEVLLESLKRLKAGVVEAGEYRWESEGFRNFFTAIRGELTDEHLAEIEAHLSSLRFKRGTLISGRLGRGLSGTGFVLHRSPGRGRPRLRRILARRRPPHVVRVHPRDEGGLREMGEIEGRGLKGVANVMAQCADDVIAFFTTLRSELAFYMGCLNLHEELLRAPVPVCFPEAEPLDTQGLHFRGLRDVALSLTTGKQTVGNDLDSDDARLMVVTGANEGGKSTFLRSLGQAQLMMQCGLFVAADEFSAGMCDGLFTHFRREEDEMMKAGKLEEELQRMSSIVDEITPRSLVLLNESFASTNEREGSELARQVVSALCGAGVRVWFVTHLVEFARASFETGFWNALSLRAERLGDGTRTFRMIRGEPLETSFAEELYDTVIQGGARRAVVREPGVRQD